MKTQRTFSIKSLFALLIATLLLASIFAGCGSVPRQGRLILKVNPEISIDYDEQGNVLAVTGENSDGKDMVSDYDDYLGKPSQKVVSELVEILDDAGYLTPTMDHQPREITLSVTADSVLPQEDFLESIAVEVNQTSPEATPLTLINKEGEKSSASPLTTQQAVDRALTHAGISANDVKFSHVEEDDDHLEVEFVSKGMKYEYKLHPFTGDILSFSSKLWDKEDVLQGSASDYLSLASVQEIVSQDLGVAVDELQFVKTELEMDDGNIYYEIDVYHGNTEYEYHIDAFDGSILKKEQDGEKKATSPTAPSATPSISDKKNGPSSSGQLTAEQAKNIALKHAGVSASNAFFEEVKLDRDDGRLEYEIEFHAGGIEYEYDIDAISGAILSVEKDHDDDSSASSGTASNEKTLISMDRAVSIALGHAGYSASQVKFDDRELDWDDGRPVYEIEFEVGDTEYEYDIDGYTGQILDYEIDD